jgi:hypothetical protein
MIVGKIDLKSSLGFQAADRHLRGRTEGQGCYQSREQRKGQVRQFTDIEVSKIMTVHMFFSPVKSGKVYGVCGLRANLSFSHLQ